MCDKNESQTINFNLNIQDVCKSFCNAFACNESNTQTTTDVDESIFTDKNITSEIAGTTMPMHTEKNTMSTPKEASSYWLLAGCAIAVAGFTTGTIVRLMYVSFDFIFILFFV